MWRPLDNCPDCPVLNPTLDFSFVMYRPYNRVYVCVYRVANPENPMGDGGVGDGWS